jgi:hypothetical protein
MKLLKRATRMSLMTLLQALDPELPHALTIAKRTNLVWTHAYHSAAYAPGIPLNAGHIGGYK